jgi:hypothetical protein
MNIYLDIPDVDPHNNLANYEQLDLAFVSGKRWVMLSVNLIERLFEARRFCRLLEAVADNGLGLPLPLRVRLSQSPVPAVAMGLGRVLDLTYGHTALSRQMAAELLSHQREDGSFGGDPLITACGAATLGRLLDEPATDHADVIGRAHEGALAALASMQGGDGLFQCDNDRTDQQRELIAAFILFLLAADERFRTSLRMAELLDWFDCRHDHMDDDTRRLWRMARAEAPALTANEAALAA